MESNDITVKILKDIRDEIRLTRGELSNRIDGLSGRIEGVSARIEDANTSLSGRIDELSRRIVDSEIRTATAMTDLAGTVREMTGALRAQHELRPRVERCEDEIAELKRRLG